MSEEGRWSAEITPSRIGYGIHPSSDDGMELLLGYWAFTARGAERKALRVVRRLNREDARHAARWTVRP